CPKEEDEPAQVSAEGVGVVGGVADEGGEAIVEGLFLAAGQPAGEEGERFGEFCRVAQVEAYLGHGGQVRSGGAGPGPASWASPSNSAARPACPWLRAWSRWRMRMGRNSVPVRK